jgi:hypothetical protein
VGSAEGVCRLGPRASEQGAKDTWVCQAPLAGTLASYLDPCELDEDCGSGLCVPMFGAQRCTKPCCESSACGAVPEGLIACDDLVHAGSVIRACAKTLPPLAMGATGMRCTSDQECRSGLCSESGGEWLCSDRCCIDAHCGDRAFVCRAAKADPTSALRCEKK